MTFPALKDAEGKLTAKRAELKSIFDEAGPDRDMSKIKSISGDNAAKVEAIRAINTEIDALAKSFDDLVMIEKAAENSERQAEGVESGAGATRTEKGRQSI